MFSGPSFHFWSLLVCHRSKRLPLPLTWGFQRMEKALYLPWHSLWPARFLVGPSYIQSNTSWIIIQFIAAYALFEPTLAKLQENHSMVEIVLVLGFTSLSPTPILMHFFLCILVLTAWVERLTSDWQNNQILPKAQKIQVLIAFTVRIPKFSSRISAKPQL